MRKISVLVAFFVMVAVLNVAVNAQGGDQTFVFGIGGGASLGQNESDDQEFQPHLRASLGSLRQERFQSELGVGYTLNGGEDYETLLIPIDMRLSISPLGSEIVSPYIYAGIGALYYNVDTAPPAAQNNVEEEGWSAMIPLGVGVNFWISQSMAIDVNGGWNYTFSDEINTLQDDDNDTYLCALIGLKFAPGRGPSDKDGDGLFNKEEKLIGTDKKNPDTDGDGLNDGDEVNTYMTNPLKADSDGDGLTDAEELNTHSTDPNKPDSDGDQLSDRDEVATHQTDPNNGDTDGDGLNDYDELMVHMTDPKNQDSDGDLLTDADEVSVHMTDPLSMDTDEGGIDDFAEVERGTDPLNPDDDFEEEEMLVVAVAAPIVLEGVVFRSGSAEVQPESEEILQKALNTLIAYPDMQVEIHGYTDNTGSRSLNMRLSLQRAEAVKQWLVDKGIEAERLTAKGFGPDNPIAPNDTREGRQQNRRIEFVRFIPEE